MSNRQLEHSETTPEKVNHHLVVVAENIHSPENVGSIFRICDALGVLKLYLTGISPKLDNRKVKKTSRSTHEYLASEHVANTQELIHQYKEKGFTCLGLEITSSSEVIHQYTFFGKQKYMLVIGSERNGIQADTLEALDGAVHIPMFGNNSSMNVATALGIGLYEIVRQCAIKNS